MKNTKLEDDIQTIREVAAVIDGTVWAAYSGGGMRNGLCYGILCDNPNRCLEEAGNRGLTHGKSNPIEGVGKKFIVYWPHIANGEAMSDME